MSSSFPILLAAAFVASLVLAVLKTARWKIVLLALAAVWGARLAPGDIALVSAGTVDAYARFALSALSVWVPTVAAALIGADLGTGILALLTPASVDGDRISE